MASSIPEGFVLVKKDKERKSSLPPGFVRVNKEPEKKASPHDDFDFDVVQMAKNIPSSASRLVANTVDAVVHPVRTGKALGNLAQSTGNYLGRKAAELVTGQEIEADPLNDESVAQGAGQAMKDRYGSVNALKRTLQNDPVGLLSDASGVGMVAGKAPMLAKVGQISAAAEPVGLMVRATKASGRAMLPKSLAPRIYESGMKLNHPDLDTQNAIVRNAMEEGVIPKEKAGFLDRRKGRKGRKEVRDEINASQAKADQLVSDATGAGTGVFASDLFKYFPDLQQKYSGIVPKGKRNRRTLNRVEQEMTDTIGPRVVLTPDEVQKFKQQANKATFDEYGRPKKDVESEAWSNLRGGAKEALEDAVPGLGEANQRTAKLINIEKPLKKTIKKMSGDKLVRYMAFGGTGVAATAAAIFGGPVVSTGVLALAYLSRPASKARIGIALNRLKTGKTDWMPESMTGAEARVALQLAAQEAQRQEQEKE